MDEKVSKSRSRKILINFYLVMIKSKKSQIILKWDKEQVLKDHGYPGGGGPGGGSQPKLMYDNVFLFIYPGQ